MTNVLGNAFFLGFVIFTIIATLAIMNKNNKNVGIFLYMISGVFFLGGCYSYYYRSGQI
jgi:hypothetical protein